MENSRYRFRAWDEHLKRMIYFGNLMVCDCTSEGFNEKVHLEAISNIEIIKYGGQYKLMQYTGLKDKYGKEIYEMDIIKQGSSLRIVKWNNERCAFDFEWIGNCTVNDFTSNDVEIIGNIHENPELSDK